MSLARGVLYVHSALPALCPHVEWALAGVFGVSVGLDWTPQPAAQGHMRAEADWEGPVGSAGAVASALAGWERLRFEVIEEATPGCDGVRHSYTPSLGMFTATIGANGDLQVPEERLRAAMRASAQGRSPLEEELDRLLGRVWDDELEPFRYAGDGAPVRWLNAAGQ